MFYRICTNAKSYRSVVETIVDLYSQDNAASIYNEVNATTGWIPAPGQETSVDLTSDSVVYQGVGAYSIKIEALGSWSYCEYEFPVTSGKTYDISIWAIPNAISAQKFDFFVGFSDFVKKTIDSTSWKEYTWTLTANITGNAMLRAYVRTTAGVNGHTLNMDNISIIEN